MKYNIRKGNFSSGIHFGLHTGRVSQTYKVRFDSFCMYDDLDSERDWNKLVGWSYKNLPVRITHEELITDKVSYTWEPGHHSQSIRIAWRANKSINKIELAGYYYQDGIRTIIPFAEIDVDKDYTIGIFYKVDTHNDEDTTEYNPRIVFTCTRADDSYFATKTKLLNKPFVVRASYKLYPYFGGSNYAPHNMSISVRET